MRVLQNIFTKKLGITFSLYGTERGAQIVHIVAHQNHFQFDTKSIASFQLDHYQSLVN